MHAPTLPIVANVTGEFYPADTDAETMVEILGRQVASPVQFVKGLHTLYDAGARVFVEVGPKKALHGFVEDVFGPAHDDVVALFTNHPKLRDATAFNQALCGLYAAGLGLPASASPAPNRANGAAATRVTPPTMTLPAAETTITEPRTSMNMTGQVRSSSARSSRSSWSGVAGSTTPTPLLLLPTGWPRTSRSS